MPLSEAQLLADVDFLIGDLPDRDGNVLEATINGNDYSVARNVLDRDKLLEIEGMFDQYRFSLYVNAKTVDDAGDRPDVNDHVTFQGSLYTVLATNDDPISQLLRLDLGEQHPRGNF